MANAFLKAEQIVRQALALLRREVVLPTLVWTDAVDNWDGAKDDTVSIRVPAYTTARTRVMRSGDQLTKDNLSETKVDMTLDTHIYKLIGITDEELTLDIREFGTQVTMPAVQAVVQGLEDAVATEMSGATYAADRTIEVDDTDPYDSLIDARKALNNANVPQGGRGLVVGSDIEAKILKSDHLAKFQESGSDTAFREAIIGRIAGFTAVSSNAIAPAEGYAFHKTAFALSTRTPKKPEGATWGATESSNGFTLRTLRDYDPNYAEDRLLVDLFAGTNHVADAGYFDANGKWQPFTGTIGDSVTLSTSAAADDIIDATAHGFVAGDRVVFTALTGGSGLTTNREYFVIADNLAANTFQVSETVGGDAALFSTDITAGTVQEGGSSQFIRAVKLIDEA